MYEETQVIVAQDEATGWMVYTVDRSGLRIIADRLTRYEADCLQADAHRALEETQNAIGRDESRNPRGY